MTSPDGLVRIGWFGDDIQPWRITAALDPIAEPQWQAVFNDAFPPEIIAAFTGAVARNWGPVHVHHRLLQPPARCVEERVEPLLQAGWQRGFQEQLKIITVEAPDGLAGAENDTIDLGPSSAGGVRLWCGPFTARADAVFPPGPPDHLVASVAAMADPEPLTRERNMIRREVEPLVRLAPVETTAPSHSQTAQPTRLDRAAYKPYGVARPCRPHPHHQHPAPAGHHALLLNPR